MWLGSVDTKLHVTLSQIVCDVNDILAFKNIFFFNIQNIFLSQYFHYIVILGLVLSTMFTEVLVALVVGGLIFFLVQRRRKHVLRIEDGWWGAGAPPDGEEDVTIRPFKVTTSDEELEVRFPLCFS